MLTKLQTAVTRVLDEQKRIQKKEKSSEFNAQDDGHIKSGQAVKAWSQWSFILTSKITKNRQKSPNEAKTRCSTGLQKKSQVKCKGF